VRATGPHVLFALATFFSSRTLPFQGWRPSSSSVSPEKRRVIHGCGVTRRRRLIDDVAGKKLDMLDAHTSQFYEMPGVDGKSESVPPPGPERRKWMAAQWLPAVREAWKPALARGYGAAAESLQYAEAFEISEYGSRPTEADVRRLFPFFPAAGAK
jgi:hypothetical protein